MRGTSPILASDWYAERAGSGLTPLGRALAAAYPRWLLRVARIAPPLRGLLIFVLARGTRGVAIVYREPGVATLLVLRALFARGARRTVLLEFIPRYVSSLGPLYRLWTAVVLHPALRRALSVAHVLSEHERDRYAAELGLDPSRLACARWPLTAGGRSGEAGPRSGVLASGRAWCDWETLFAAAASRSWDLTVVCSERDLARVRALNRDGRARVRCEIPHAEHERALRAARVFVIPIRSGAPSAGQVRLMEAGDTATPMVVSRVAPVEEYVRDGEALLVEPGAPAELGEAVDRLLESSDLARTLTAARAKAAATWTYDGYFDCIEALVERAILDPWRSGSRPSS